MYRAEGTAGIEHGFQMRRGVNFLASEQTNYPYTASQLKWLFEYVYLVQTL
jgi:hypothetical protein